MERDQDPIDGLIEHQQAKQLDETIEFGAPKSQSMIELIDAYARTYHRWAKQPTNAELDAERKRLHEQIERDLAATADTLIEAAGLIMLLTEKPKMLTNAKIFEYGPTFWPPHPDWKITSVTPVAEDGRS
jgi:hypothetical protein